MGVDRKDWNGEGAPPLPELNQSCRTKCANRICLDTLIVLALVHEDEQTVGYAGACSTCGLQYHMVIDKETS